MFQLSHTDERVLEQLHRRRAPQSVDAIAATLAVTHDVAVLSLARLQLANLAEPAPCEEPGGQRCWKAKG
jgi:predicted transcriptional regulator